MPKKNNMIDLGRKPSSSEAKPSKPEKNPVYYPSLSFSPDGPIEFPKGAFNARVKLKLKRSENSEDENGKKRHSYTLDIHGVHPEFEECEDCEKKMSPADEAAEEAGEDDAATRILKSMGRARQKKASRSVEE